jgi:hypothetical protein
MLAGVRGCPLSDEAGSLVVESRIGQVGVNRIRGDAHRSIAMVGVVVEQPVVVGPIHQAGCSVAEMLLVQIVDGA